MKKIENDLAKEGGEVDSMGILMHIMETRFNEFNLLLKLAAKRICSKNSKMN